MGPPCANGYGLWILILKYRTPLSLPSLLGCDPDPACDRPDGATKGPAMLIASVDPRIYLVWSCDEAGLRLDARVNVNVGEGGDGELRVEG